MTGTPRCCWGRRSTWPRRAISTALSWSSFSPPKRAAAAAKQMVEDGLIERFGIQEVYGMHNWPGLPVGPVCHPSGAVLCRNRPVRDRGRSARVAMRQCRMMTVDTTRDGRRIWSWRCKPSLAQCRADRVRSWSRSPAFRTESERVQRDPANVSHCAARCARCDTDMRDLAEERLKAIVATGSPLALAARAKINWMRGYPVMVNARGPDRLCRRDRREGRRAMCNDAPLIMGGEDFAYMLEECPGAYILIGNGDTARCITRSTTSTTRRFRPDAAGGPRLSSSGCRFSPRPKAVDRPRLFRRLRSGLRNASLRQTLRRAT